MATIFSKIVSGEIPCYKIAETNDFLAFLDINPVKKGHVLVIPKREIDYYFDLDDELFIGINLFTKIVSEAIKKAIPCKKVGVAVVGLEVPHAHIHLIPIENVSDMNFANERLKLSGEELDMIAQKIREKL
jgi:histidine triad (HIT) family protein